MYSPVTGSKLAVNKIILTNFRNYVSFSLSFDSSIIVITGNNGVGKTNILEAISFLTPGKGIRSVSNLENIANNADWSVFADIDSSQGNIKLGTGISKNSAKRIIKIDGKALANQAELAAFFSCIWFTPQIDGIFIEAASLRRRFFDRIVYNFNPDHASLIYSYEYHLKQRSKLLANNIEGKKIDIYWLNLLEEKIAQKAVALAHSRVDAVRIIQASIDNTESIFPRALIDIIGFEEDILKFKKALEAEEFYQEKLKNNRKLDAITKKCQYGPHRSDFSVTYKAKNIKAANCSTGEQKSLLLCIIFGQIRAKIKSQNITPVLLLDEIAAHLDERTRFALFEEIRELNCQSFLTGVDKDIFVSLQNEAQFINL